MAEVLTPHFWTGLLTIIWVNIILSGDNAVVIALAARSLPERQQKQAVMWGAGAAVVMRIILTIVAVELLKRGAMRRALVTRAAGPGAAAAAVLPNHRRPVPARCGLKRATVAATMASATPSQIARFARSIPVKAGSSLFACAGVK